MPDLWTEHPVENTHESLASSKGYEAGGNSRNITRLYPTRTTQTKSRAPACGSSVSHRLAYIHMQMEHLFRGLGGVIGSDQDSWCFTTKMRESITLRSPRTANSNAP